MDHNRCHETACGANTPWKGGSRLGWENQHFRRAPKTMTSSSKDEKKEVHEQWIHKTRPTPSPSHNGRVATCPANWSPNHHDDGVNFGRQKSPRVRTQASINTSVELPRRWRRVQMTKKKEVHNQWIHTNQDRPPALPSMRKGGNTPGNRSSPNHHDDGVNSDDKKKNSQGFGREHPYPRPKPAADRHGQLPQAQRVQCGRCRETRTRRQ